MAYLKKLLDGSEMTILAPPTICGFALAGRLYPFPEKATFFTILSPSSPYHPFLLPRRSLVDDPGEMVSPENTNWLFDYGLIDDIPVPDSTFPVANPGFSWTVTPLNASSSVSLEIDGSLGEHDELKECGSKKRVRTETNCSKACREKLRRDRLNDKFLELGAIMEPGKPPKTDKAAILNDAIRMVTQMRTEAQKLKDSNSCLQEKIKELKVEKNELRDEKQRLKGEKEKLEQEMKSLSTTPPSFMASPPPIPPAFAAPAQVPGNKLVPFISYPGVAMWQFMPPTSVDTSQDHVLRPPVA